MEDVSFESGESFLCKGKTLCFGCVEVQVRSVGDNDEASSKLPEGDHEVVGGNSKVITKKNKGVGVGREEDYIQDYI